MTMTDTQEPVPDGITAIPVDGDACMLADTPTHVDFPSIPPPSLPSTTGSLTVFTSTRPAQLGKVFSIQDGQLNKTVAANMVEGYYEVKAFNNRPSFAKLLMTIGTNQAICTSLPRLDTWRGRVVVESKAKTAGCLARTKNDFPFKAVPGVLTLDYDPPKGQTALTRDELLGKFLLLCPAAANAGVIWWCSGSSHIHGPAGEMQGLRGQRLYVLIQDISDTERTGAVLRDLCWLNGLGRIEISSSGSLLKRSLWDEMMSQAARLDFIGGAVCTPPLHQERGEPVLLGGDGWLDTRTALLELTESQRSAVARAQRDACEIVKDAANAIRLKWTDGRVRTEATQLQNEKKLPEAVALEQARRFVEAALAGTLQGDFRIPLPNGAFVTVSTVLENWQTWDRKKTLDPLEPEHRGGEACGMLFLSGATPVLFTFAHGGMTFRLTRKPERVLNVQGRQSFVADKLAQALSSQGDVFLSGSADLVQALPGRFMLLDKAAIQYLLGHRVLLVNMKDGRDVSINMPVELVALAMAALGQKPKQTPPQLLAVTSLPYATANRRLVTTAGFDQEAGVYNTMQGEEIELPDPVTREDCLQALITIWAPWAEYVWATSADRAGMLAAIFTTVLRPAMSIAPAVFFDAPVQASGKTKAAQALGALMTGGYVGVSPFVEGRNQEPEYSKEIIAMLRSERRFWLLDNVKGRFQSAVLSGLITSGRVQGRILGLSKDGDFSGRVMLVATGNNATLDSDLNRRFLCCRIDTGVEKPSEVNHRFEPAQLAKETRLQIAVAVLTILKACWASQAVIVQGGRDFHEWTALVREPILWLQQHGLTVQAGIGEVTDPAKALGGGGSSADPAEMGYAQLLAGVNGSAGLNKTFTAKDVYRWYLAGELNPQPPHALVREGLDNIVPVKGVTVVSIGRILANRRDRWAGGLKLTRFGDSKLGAHWKVSK